MFTNPEAFVQAEIDRRLELAGAYQWHRPLPVTRRWQHLRDLFSRQHTTGTAGARPIPLSSR